jgi:uncharacterized membrane protein YedE/YeeE
VKPTVGVALFGFLLGFSLDRIGFSDWGEVHRMFLFADLRLFLTFATGVTLTMIGFFALFRGEPMPRRAIHRGTIPGGVLFGVGWALTGACPGIILVQLGEGQLPGLVTLAGVLAGTALYPRLHARFFRWDPGSCEA